MHRRDLTLTAATSVPFGGQVGRGLDDLGAARWAFYAGTALVGVQTFRPAISFTASDWLFLFSLGATLLSVAHRRPTVATGGIPAAFVLGAFLYALGSLVSIFGSPVPLESLGIVGRFVFLTTVWVWLSKTVLYDVQHVRLAIALWTASVAVSGAAAAIQLLFGDVIPGSDPSFGRMPGLSMHVNDLGGTAAVALAPALVQPFLSSSGFSQITAFAGAALIAIGLFLSGSVGSLLAAFVGVAVVTVTLGRLIPGKYLFVVGLLSLSLAAVVSVAEDRGGITPAGRISEVRSEDGSLAIRLEVFGNAIARIGRNPLIGVGPQPGGARTTEGKDGTQVHNALLGVWYESGFFGLLGFVIVIGGALRAARDAIVSSTTRQDRILATSLLAAFTAYLAFGLSEPTLYTRYGWMPIALVVALSIANRNLHDSPSPA